MKNSTRFPGESEAYRSARNQLLEEETALAKPCPSCTSILDSLDGEAPHIHHFYNTELLYAPPDRGQHGRHVDLIWPLWNMFDLTPEGRGEKWGPRLAY